MKNVLLALSVLSLSVSAQAGMMKQIKTPSSLKAIYEKCEADRKGYGRRVSAKLECPSFEVYKMPKDFNGMTAEEIIYNEFGGSLFETDADKAYTLIERSFHEQFLDAIPAIEDGIEETMSYYQDTVDDLDMILQNAQKGKHAIWHNDPADHDGSEARAFIYDENKGIVIVITHSRVRG